MADLEDKIKGWTTGEWEVPEWSFDGNPALIINHMQMGIAGTGKCSRAPYAQEKEAMDRLHTIEKQKKLIAAFRERKLPVIFISVVCNPIGVLPKWGHIFEMSGYTTPPGHLDHPYVRELTEVMPEMGRLPEEPVLFHTGHSPFTGTHLNELLRHHGAKDLVFTGWTIHSTLYNSVIQATNHWYSVVVPWDASGSPKRDEECGEIVRKKMMRMWALVTTVDDVIKHLPNSSAATAK